MSLLSTKLHRNKKEEVKQIFMLSSYVHNVVVAVDYRLTTFFRKITTRFFFLLGKIRNFLSQSNGISRSYTKGKSARCCFGIFFKENKEKNCKKKNFDEEENFQRRFALFLLFRYFYIQSRARIFLLIRLRVYVVVHFALCKDRHPILLLYTELCYHRDMRVQHVCVCFIYT